MSSVGATPSSALQYLSQATVNASNGQSTTSATPLGPTPGGKKHHHKGGGNLLSQIQSAVTSALSSPGGSTTASTAAGGSTATDANSTITSAIEKVLKQGLSAAGTAASSASAADADSADATNSTDSATSAGGTTFAQLLAAHGLSTEDFQKDLQTAFQSVSSAAGTNLGTTGNLLDVAG